MSAKAAVLLLTIYSPQSAYFVGPSIETFVTQTGCLGAAKAKIGTELKVRMWETQMMGPIPKAISAYCVPGFVEEEP